MARFCGLIIVILFSLPVFANIAITKEKKSLSGLQQIGLVQMKSNWNMTMNSNYFLREQNQAGLFELINEKELKKELEKIVKLYKKLKANEKNLKRTASQERISALEYYYNIGGVKVRGQDYYFEKIDTIFNKILSQIKLNQVSGYKIDKQKLEILKANKVISTSQMDYTNCESSGKNRVCKIKGQGQFFW